MVLLRRSVRKTHFIMTNIKNSLWTEPLIFKNRYVQLQVDCLLDENNLSFLKGCSIGGMNLTHNSWQFISKESTQHCFKCACYMGELKCSQPDRKLEIEHCIGEECSKEYESPSTSISKISSR